MNKHRPIPIQREILTGYSAAIASAFSYGAGALVAQKIVAEYSSPVVGSAFSLLFGVIIAATLFARQAFHDGPLVSRKSLLFLIGTGTSSAVGVVFYFLALDYGPVVLVAPVVGAYPLVTIAMSHVFLRNLEKVTWRMVLGATMIVAGITIITLGQG